MPEAKPEAENPGRTEKKRRKRQREGRRASHPLTEFGKTRESLGRRARGSSSAAPAFRTIRRRPATGLDERSKKSEGKRRKPPLGKPDRPAGSEREPDGGPEARESVSAVRTRTRSALSSKSASAVEVEMRGRRGPCGPTTKGWKGAVGEIRVPPRPTCFSPFELARTNLPESSRKSGSKTARSAFGRRPKTEDASDGSESDVSKKRTEEPQRRRPRAAPASSVRFTRSRTPLGRASARSTNTVGQP